MTHLTPQQQAFIDQLQAIGCIVDNHYYLSDDLTTPEQCLQYQNVADELFSQAITLMVQWSDKNS